MANYMNIDELPNNKEFFKSLVEYLKYKKKFAIAKLIESTQGLDCKIIYELKSDFFDGRYYATIFFYVPVTHLDNFEKEFKSNIIRGDFISYCNLLLGKYHYLLREYLFRPNILKINDKQSLTQDLEDALAGLPLGLSQKILPPDIKDKGKEMAEVYIYLYYVENSLRFFIEDIYKDFYGDNYFDKINLPKIKKRIEGRKNEEKKKEYMPFRGTSDIFYLDFVDLSSIISEEWKLFESYFPELPWITSKIKELAEIRNYIAHNSYIEKHQIDILKTYYTMILKQIEKKYS